jgi:hypothetical protein
VDIDWDDLQAAFLSMRTDREYYLDRETGEVLSISEDDEGEDEPEAEDGEEGADEECLREEIDSDPDRYVLLSPVPISDLVEWMNSFIQTVKGKELTAPLQKAANSHQPDREFDRALRKNPIERLRWIGFLETQVQETIDGWIEENDLESDTPPPWKVKAVRRRPPKKAAGSD